MNSKLRIDQLLVDRGIAASRTQAQAMIMAGLVSGENAAITKPGASVAADAKIHVKSVPKYVSRAGDKLASVAQELDLSFAGKTVLDVGSSTGGFTDYALQRNAAKVYCVDVGTAQLAYRLRNDSRVVVMEKTDIRDAKLPESADMAVIDVSFISLTKIMSAVGSLVRAGGDIVAMAKPQFEVGKVIADKYHGVIPVGDERTEVLNDLREFFMEDFEVLAEADSHVAGSEGNVEHFFRLRNAN